MKNPLDLFLQHPLPDSSRSLVRLLTNLVDLAECRATNSTYHLFIDFVQKKSPVRRSLLYELYVKDGLSIQQIADKMGWSKTFVQARLTDQKLISSRKGKLTNPKNYRHHTTPYWYRVFK